MVVVGVLSGKGGVGKTTVTSNVATALSNEFRRKVIVLDTNVSSSHIHLHFGLVNGFEKTLPDVINGRANIYEATYAHRITGVDIVPTSSGLNRNLDLGKLIEISGNLAVSPYDFVILDASPGFGDDVMNTINISDKILLVTTPAIPDVSDALKLVELAKKRGKKICVILNKVKGKKYELSMHDVEKMLGSDVLMVIPEDEKIPESISRGTPVVVFSGGAKASIAFKKLAASLIGEEYRPSTADRIKWFFNF